MNTNDMNNAAGSEAQQVTGATTSRVPEKLHIKMYDCNAGGRLDLGSMLRVDAISEVSRMIAAGDLGGCRCERGWKLSPCPNGKHDCSRFNRKKFEFWDDVDS